MESKEGRFAVTKEVWHMLGTLVNTATVILGGLLGLLLGTRVPQRLRDTVMQGIGLCTLVIGALSAMDTASVLTLIICMVLGGFLGEGINIEKRLERLGSRAQALLVREQAAGSLFVQGFMTASLLFCVGPMSIVGPLESGLSGNHATQVAKALMDGVAAIFLSAALGPGVLLSAAAVLAYQGAITLGASLLAPLLTSSVIVEMSAVGGVIIMGIGFTLTGVGKIRVGNMLPAIFLPIAYLPLVNWISTL